VAETRLLCSTAWSERSLACRSVRIALRSVTRETLRHSNVILTSPIRSHTSHWSVCTVSASVVVRLSTPTAMASCFLRCFIPIFTGFSFPIFTDFLPTSLPLAFHVLSHTIPSFEVEFWRPYACRKPRGLVGHDTFIPLLFLFRLL